MSAKSKEPQLYVFQETALRLGIENFKKDWDQATPEFVAHVEELRALECRLLKSKVRTGRLKD